jgi:hypothetical protein
MKRFAKFFLSAALISMIVSIASCSGGSPGSGATSQNPITPSVTVIPASTSITMAQSLAVTITVSGTTGMPTGSVILASGSYTSTATALSSGTANITIPSGSLSTGADTLTAKYAPDSGSSSTYNSASGTASVTVTGPTVAVAVNIDALAVS